MRNERRLGAIRRTPHVVALLITAAAVAEPTPKPKPVELLRVASDEPLVLRFGAPVRASRLGSQTMRIVADGTNEPAHGQYVAGTFLKDKDTGSTEVVDPDVCREAVQIALGLSRDDAREYVERALARHESTGGRVDVFDLRVAFDRLAGVDPFDYHAPFLLTSVGAEYQIPPQQDDSASDDVRTRRLLAAGDDDLWAAHMAGDETAFAKLASDPRFERFWHAPDPLTGASRPESEMRRREHRRVLFDRRPHARFLTFVPDVPQAGDLTDLGYVMNTRYLVTLARGLPTSRALFAESGSRLALHGRRATFETTNSDDSSGQVIGAPLVAPRFASSELVAAPAQVVDVTPPHGERLVDPTTDWEDPDDRHHVALADRRPFRVRLRFDRPLDPRTVSPQNVWLTMTESGVDTPTHYWINSLVPSDVRLRQSRLGVVEVELAPHLLLDPKGVYEVFVFSRLAALDGRVGSSDRLFAFATAPADEAEAPPPVGFDDDFTDMAKWHEAGASPSRSLQTADVAHDPDGRHIFVPFLGDDPNPVLAIETDWIDSGVTSPRYRLVLDDPATPQYEGTSIHVPANSNVRLFMNATSADVQDSNGAVDAPNPFLVTGWVEFDLANPGTIGPLWLRFFKLRVEFTLPPGATPDTIDLPSIDRLTVRAERP
jgi:hypothetical protein